MFILQAYFVDSLIKAYHLSDHMDVFKVKPSSYEDLVQFHSSAYIDFLKNVNDSNISSVSEAEDEYGIGTHNISWKISKKKKEKQCHCNFSKLV